MGEDKELERIKLRKMLELKRKLLEAKSKQTKQDESPKQILSRFLTERAQELLKLAEEQYPRECQQIVEILAKFLSEKGARRQIDDVSLYNIFLYFGLKIHLPTRIHIVRHGERKSFEELLKGI